MARTSLSGPQNTEGYRPRIVTQPTKSRSKFESSSQPEQRRNIGQDVWKVIKSYIGGLILGEDVKPMKSGSLIKADHGNGPNYSHDFEAPTRQLTPHASSEVEDITICTASHSYEPLAPEISEHDLVEMNEHDQLD